MANIRIDLNHTPLAGEAIKFKAPCDAKDITGLTVYYVTDANEITSKEFTLTDANGGDIGVVDSIFSAGAIVKVILDTDANNAFVQNPDTNTYLERRFEGKANKDHTHTADSIKFENGDTIAKETEVKALVDRVEALEENGGGSGANIMIVNMTWHAEYGCMLCDKTTDEMLEATNNGITVIGLMKEQTHGAAIASHKYAACFLFYANVSMVQYWLGEYICEKEIDTIDGEERELWNYSPQPLGNTVVRLYDGVPQMDVYRISDIAMSGRSVVLEADGDIYTYVGGVYPYHFVRYDPEEGILYGCNVYDDHVEFFEKTVTSDPATRSWVKRYVSEQLGVIENGTY